jgi:predicted amidohydrolase
MRADRDRLDIWIVQSDPVTGEVSPNVATLNETFRTVGPGLVVAPAIALSGYRLSQEQWQRAALTVEQITEAIRPQASQSAVVGFPERVGADLYNAAALIDSQKRTTVQRKRYPIAYPPFRETTVFRRGASWQVQTAASVPLWHPDL